ncbi:MAG: hypothetical protein K6T66_11085 [Peptococcaceae bacterium]|nr:hypothetical protein [Peptococcaceae bacterium]
MLSEREVMELNDRIMTHIGLIEKYRVFAGQCPDPQVRDLVARHQQVLQNHYQMMVGLMQNAQNPQGMAAIQAQWRPS